MQTTEDRRPVDTNIFNHTAADKWFKRNLGIAFRSDHIMFTSGDIDIAVNYGYPFAAFPYDGYKYCWSSNVDDLTEALPPNTDMLKLPPHERTAIVDKVMDSAQYQTTNLRAAIRSENEIMIQCGTYLLIDPEQIDIPKLLAMY